MPDSELFTCYHACPTCFLCSLSHNCQGLGELYRSNICLNLSLGDYRNTVAITALNRYLLYTTLLQHSHIIKPHGQKYHDLFLWQSVLAIYPTRLHYLTSRRDSLGRGNVEAPLYSKEDTFFISVFRLDRFHCKHL